MSVEVIPVGHIKTRLENKIPGRMDVAGLSVAEFLSQLPIDSGLIVFTVVNGRMVNRDHVLEDGDSIKLVPMVGGG